MTQDLYFAAGCFWGAQKFFAKVKGVTFTEVGFANGFTENPTYKEVYTDRTGYAETVHLQYDTDIITEERLTELFLKAIDPLSLNKQGEDEGTRYRTGVYFVTEAQVPGISAALDPPELLPRRGIPPGLPRKEPHRLLPPLPRHLPHRRRGLTRPVPKARPAFPRRPSRLPRRQTGARERALCALCQWLRCGKCRYRPVAHRTPPSWRVGPGLPCGILAKTNELLGIGANPQPEIRKASRPSFYAS